MHLRLPRARVRTMAGRKATVRPGRRFGWWVEGRKANGKLFMKTWWPVHGIALAIARWVAGPEDPAV